MNHTDEASTASSTPRRERREEEFPSYDSSESRSPGSPPDDADLSSGIPSATLRAAARRVLARWRENASGENLGREAELTDQLVEVAEWVVQATAGEPIEAGTDGIALRRRLLELLRGELMAVWREGEESSSASVNARQLIALLGGMESVQRELSPRWDKRFGVDLSGPSGLELAVEVAHDFRSPLSSILFLADTIRSGGSGELNDLQVRQLNLIYSAALSMVSMAEDVVDLGREGHAMTDREPVQFSVSEVMDSVRHIVQPVAEAKGLTFSVKPPEGDHRLGYPEGLRRVLLNLTTNAAKFTSEGYIDLTAQTRGPHRVQFSVRDTGPGIGDASRSELYQAFRPFQGRSGFHFSGTGLGLTIARKLVHAMDGELRYETQKNLGTRFYFTIPLLPVDGI